MISLPWQICEDIPEELDVDVPGLSERPINIFMPRLLQVILAALSEIVCRCLLVTITRATIEKLSILVSGTVFPVSTCHIEEAIIGFHQSVYRSNAFSE